MVSKLPKIIRNAVRCKKCDDTVESRHVHDFKWCSCRAIFTDGGLSYIRRGGDLDSMEDLSVYQEDEGTEK